MARRRKARVRKDGTVACTCGSDTFTYEESQGRGRGAVVSTYFMAVVVAIDAPNAEAAFSAINNPDDPIGVDGKVVYGTNPFVGERRMADDPDFHVPTIEYAGKPLPLADEED